MTAKPGHAVFSESGQTLGLLAAVNDEIAPTLKALRLVEKDDHFAGNTDDGMAILAMVSGIGASHAVSALDRLMELGATHIVQLGFAGGLDPRFNAGDLLNVQAVVTEADAPHPLANQPEQESLSHPDPITLLTLNRIADSVQLKRDLFEAHGTAAVDMESYHTARAASERGVRFTLLRAISDPATMALPPVVSEWVKPDGRPDMAKAMSYIATHPLQAPMLMKLNAHAKLAARNLATRVVSLLNAQGT